MAPPSADARLLHRVELLLTIVNHGNGALAFPRRAGDDRPVPYAWTRLSTAESPPLPRAQHRKKVREIIANPKYRNRGVRLCEEETFYDDDPDFACALIFYPDGFDTTELFTELKVVESSEFQTAGPEVD